MSNIVPKQVFIRASNVSFKRGEGGEGGRR